MTPAQKAARLREVARGVIRGRTLITFPLKSSNSGHPELPPLYGTFREVDWVAPNLGVSAGAVALQLSVAGVPLPDRVTWNAYQIVSGGRRYALEQYQETKPDGTVLQSVTLYVREVG